MPTTLQAARTWFLGNDLEETQTTLQDDDFDLASVNIENLDRRAIIDEIIRNRKKRGQRVKAAKRLENIEETIYRNLRHFRKK